MNALKKVIFLAIAILYPILKVIGQPQNEWTIEELSSFTVMLVSDDNSKSGTGTVIRHGENYFILTAKHVAQFINERSMMLVKMSERNHGNFPLKQIIGEKLNIENHPLADISLIQLQLNKVDIDYWFYKNSFPSEHIFNGGMIIGRDRQLTFLGYPYVDVEKQNRFMPMSFDCKFSSESQSYHFKKDNIEINCDVMFLDRISIEGASGGGLYAFVKRDLNFLTTSNTQLIGIISGNHTVETKRVKISDKDEKFYESRFAFVMPSQYIWDLLNQ